MDIATLISSFKAEINCDVYPPTGTPKIDIHHFMPDDLSIFYTLCGGLVLFKYAPHPLHIVAPTNVLLANPIIVGSKYEEDDISSSWYIIGESRNEEYITIDLSRERLGRCYDSFWDNHAVAGSCPIIALSFTELLLKWFQSKGQEQYWTTTDFISLGDAYNK